MVIEIFSVAVAINKSNFQIFWAHAPPVLAICRPLKNQAQRTCIQNSNASVNDPTAGTALPISNGCLTTFSENEKPLGDETHKPLNETTPALLQQEWLIKIPVHNT